MFSLFGNRLLLRDTQFGGLTVIFSVEFLVCNALMFGSETPFFFFFFFFF